MRRLYGRDHLDHVLGTFGLILFFNEAVRLIWGPAGMNLALPMWLNTAVQVIPGIYYPAYRLSIIVVALAVAVFLYVLVMRTRIGMLIRAGASDREMVGALGVNIKLLSTLIFGIGAALAGLAGLMQAPILTAQIGMGENILIVTFVVIIIGGIGSIRGAFIASIFVGLTDTIGRAFLPDLLKLVLSHRRRLDRGPCPLVDADLSGDGGDPDRAARGPVPGVEQMIRDPRIALIAALLIFLALLPVYVHARRQQLPAQPVHAHHHPGARRDQPQSHPRLWRHGELRARRLHRNRRVCGRDSGEGRNSVRLHPMAARARRLGALRARDRRAVAAHARRLFHHDHARVRADALLRGGEPRPLRRRRRPDHLSPQPVRAAQPLQQDRLLLLVFRAAARGHFPGLRGWSIPASAW